MGGVGDFIQDEIIDPIKKVGSEIDDFVNEEIPGGWYTVGALAGGAYLANAGAAGAGTAGATAGATEAAAATGATSGGAATAVVPSAFESAVGSALGGGAELGSFGNLGTAGFGSALPPASEVAAGLAAPAVSTYILTGQVDPNSCGIQLVKFVNQVGYMPPMVGTVVSGTHSMRLVVKYPCVIPATIWAVAGT